ncbi:MAG: hypothetical protein WBB60_16240 [Nitrospira sp.]|jgi:hypothetical protein|nr:hypothetical protein [Nitrospira sp.]MBP6604510.1 hypothetical protein [Nitrospira sp.]HQY57880.1 hypothetical protein [Nitrospira sp.]
MARQYVMNATRKKQQVVLNKKARAAVLGLNSFKKKLIQPLRPLMWEFDWKVLEGAIRIVRQELRNQTLTLK